MTDRCEVCHTDQSDILNHLRLLHPDHYGGGPGSVVVDITPDPRLSNMRPGWLNDDTSWRRQLDAMDADDVQWIEHQWEQAGGRPVALDTSWLTMETLGPSGRAVALTVSGVLLGALLIWLVGALP